MRFIKELLKLDPSTLTKYELQRLAFCRYWMKSEKHKGEGEAINHMTRHALMQYIAFDHPDYS